MGTSCEASHNVEFWNDSVSIEPAKQVKPEVSVPLALI